MNPLNATVRALLVHPKDNIATLMNRADSGDNVVITDLELMRLGTIRLEDSIESFHKVSVHEITSGEHVIKFGESIGVSSQRIPQGSHVHVHNVISDRL
ncbi:UxaA family hydrolase [Candidatus Bipolaricaulota bacterium]|nr:UxaA family hydrolase [Candidatus Bipolaricaulota bacterium]